jgi:hypothetical protein
MKKRLTLWAAGLAFLAATLSPLVFHAHPGSPQPGVPPAAPRAAAASPAPQVGREIKEAMRLLAEAKHHLEVAPSDYHGHRKRAVVRVNEAIEECRMALESGE